jgi:predicted ATP-grasp superfamily ATP-dependent carboligase
MNIFVYEYISATGCRTSPSLLQEGAAMLDAVLHDMGRCPGVQTTTLLAANLPGPTTKWPNNTVHLTDPLEEPMRFVDCVARADFTLVIAPEFDDIMLERCRRVEECGGRLLGPSAEAVRLTADKLALAEHFRRHNVPTPATFAWDESNEHASLPVAFPLVCKPRFGAGSQATFLVKTSDDLESAARCAATEGWGGKMIFQPYQEGAAASVAFLVGRDTTVVLPGAVQHLSDDGRFHYQGGTVPLPPAVNARAQRVALRAVESVTGLFGYVGVDVVLGGPADGRADVAIEINPRLTTSYIGLRQLARGNLAEALLAVAIGGTAPFLDWNEEPIRFASYG